MSITKPISLIKVHANLLMLELTMSLKYYKSQAKPVTAVQINLDLSQNGGIQYLKRVGALNDQLLVALTDEISTLKKKIVSNDKAN